jgi:hypothetical protein
MNSLSPVRLYRQSAPVAALPHKFIRPDIERQRRGSLGQSWKVHTFTVHESSRRRNHNFGTMWTLALHVLLYSQEVAGNKQAAARGSSPLNAPCDTAVLHSS